MEKLREKLGHFSTRFRDPWGRNMAFLLLSTKKEGGNKEMNVYVFRTLAKISILAFQPQEMTYVNI